MSISAQLAQGTTIAIGGSAAASLNLVSCTAGYPTVLTFLNATVATALNNGDNITIAGVSGADAALLNVTTVATHKAIGATNTTFTVDINTTGKTIVGTAATATPSAWIPMGQIKGIKPSGASASSIDVTDLDSTAHEFRSGLINNGTVSLDLMILESNAGQAAALAAFTAGTAVTFKVTTTAKVRTFAATLLKFPTVPDATIDGVQTGSMEFQISGAVTVA